MGESAEDWWRAAEKERDAAVLCRNHGMLNQCYHHTGQSLEFALKAIYMKRNGHRTMPPECKGARWHQLAVIAAHARIDTEMGGLRSDRRLHSNWLTAKDWDSNARFPGRSLSKQEVTDLMVAAFNPAKGIFGWLEGIFQKS